VLLLDDDYSVYRDDTDPGYPGGKAIPVSAGNRTDGTPWRATWFNTIFGFFQALIVEAWGEITKTVPGNPGTITGEPDKVGESDLLNALQKIISDRIANLVEEAPSDGRAYARRNKVWSEITGGGGGVSTGDAIKALKFWSDRTLMITNADTVTRRARGWDIGLPYLSAGSRVYHFDTDLLDQNQETNLVITGAPTLMGKDDYNGEMYINPAVFDSPPYEMNGRSLYGNFSLRSVPVATSVDFTAEMWLRLFEDRPAVLLSLTSGMESITVRLGQRGAAEPEYSAAELDGIEYSVPGIPLEYSLPESDGMSYSAAESDGVGYSAGEQSIPYSLAETNPGNIAVHAYSSGGSETASLDDAGITIPEKLWVHIALIATPDVIALYIDEQKIEFNRKSNSAQPFSLILNPMQAVCNIDDLLLDETAAVSFAVFKQNTSDRIPYAGLDYREKWFVLEAQDTQKVKTNLFETPEFRSAVRAAVEEIQEGV
jgi:hypothetical protein